jgi:hypothetical protein
MSKEFNPAEVTPKVRDALKRLVDAAIADKVPNAIDDILDRLAMAEPEATEIMESYLMGLIILRSGNFAHFTLVNDWKTIEREGDFGHITANQLREEGYLTGVSLNYKGLTICQAVL